MSHPVRGRLRWGAGRTAAGLGAALALMLVPDHLAAAPWAAPGAGDARVHVTFLIDAPRGTPAGDTLWISGDHPVLGGWSGAGVPLRRVAERRYAATVGLPRGTLIEFKVTRGGWGTVEKDSAGRELANRRFSAASDDSVRVSVATWRDQTEGRAVPGRSTLSGDIRRHPAFPSRFVRPRDVLVYLPPGYAADSSRRYPVLYLQDGNNVFDAATSFLGIEWGVDEEAERLIRAGEVRPFIAVAVFNTPERVIEYTFARDSAHGGGGGAGYRRFLIEELKPFVDHTYRTLEGPTHTAVVGSSLGGLLALDLGLSSEDVFGLVGCISPAAWWAGRDMVRRAASGEGAGLRVWLDIGTREGSRPASAVADVRALRDALLARGYREGTSLHYEEVEGAPHNEQAWAARVGRMMVFLLGPPRGW